MDTFEDTLTNEDYARILHNPPPDSRDLSLLHEAARIWEGFIGYHSYPNPFDCIENDTELMDGFFGWLDEVVLDDKGKKEETGKELNRLDAYCRDFAWHKQFIAEKAFYFKGFLESLHGESERAANGKLLTSPTKEV